MYMSASTGVKYNEKTTMGELLLNGKPIVSDTEWLKKQEFNSAYDAELALLETGAYEWMKLIATHDTSGRLSIEETAANLGLQVIHDQDAPFRGYVKGLETGDIGSVTVALKDMDDRVTFGHEVAHIFSGLVLGQREQYGESVEEELFCDVFGYEMAIPKSELNMFGGVDGETIVQLCQRFGVRPRDAIFRLMLAGKLPPKVNVDTMFAKSENPDFDNAILRHEVCYNCEHSLACQPGEATLTLDLTDYEFYGSMPDCKRRGYRFHDKAARLAVQALYDNRQQRLF
jgi:hypothetical protein